MGENIRTTRYSPFEIQPRIRLRRFDLVAKLRIVNVKLQRQLVQLSLREKRRTIWRKICNRLNGRIRRNASPSNCQIAEPLCFGTAGGLGRGRDVIQEMPKPKGSGTKFANVVNDAESREHLDVEGNRVINIRRLASQQHQLLQSWFQVQLKARMRKLRRRRRRHEERKRERNTYASKRIRIRVEQFLSRADQGGWGDVD